VAFGTPAEAQRAGISTVYQEVNLVPQLSVARNIFLGREPRRFGLIDLGTMHRRAREAVGRLGLQIDVTADLSALGLGARQMVALARAVAVDARVVIMDEPTSSLEAAEVATLFEVTRALRDSGVGVVYVSHRLDELWELCDSVTILRDGRHVLTTPMAALGRRDLVAHMLGREIADLPVRERVTASAEEDQIEPALHVDGLSVRHRLRDVGFRVRPGETLGLAGLLGSGRTETVQAVYGALRRDAGTVTVAGRPLRPHSVRAALRAGIALLAEDRKADGLIPDLSIRDNIAIAALPAVSRFGVIDDRAVDRLVATFMSRLRIKAAGPGQCVRELSGGNQQKVLLARWLCTEPRVFLLDEPTRGIDVGAKAEVRALVDELAEQGLAVVLISSETDDLVQSADRVLVLHDGAAGEELAGDDVSASRLLHALVGEAPAMTGGA
jgi:ribose transport system ATP-binding protein